jgi:hypothetical protein
LKLLYISIHEILERDELALFSELGIDVFSYQGAYMYPNGAPTLKRPGIKGLEFHEDLANEALLHAKTKIPVEFFNQFDAVMIMHDPNVIGENWDRMKHKKVIWRSIGQSTPHVENMVRRMKYEGMKVVRMSEKEKNIVGYIGEDAVIPFYKDPEEWKDWNGNNRQAINFTQSLLGRRAFCHYDAIMKIAQGFPFTVYGSGNTDLGGLDGGELPFSLMQGALRDNRVFIYGGTWPSPYTLAFQEALMTGIPVVAIGKHLAEELPEIAVNDRIDYYQIPDIIINGKNGFCSSDINSLRGQIDQLMNDHDLARRIGESGRRTAIELYGKEKIKLQWKEFFDSL